MSYSGDYPYIEAWGRFMGSFAYFINDQKHRARVDGAPQDAIYERDGKWVRFGEITNPSAIHAMENILKSMEVAHDA